MTASRHIRVPYDGGPLKHCSRCRSFIPVEDFPRQPRNKSGLASWCRGCHAIANREKRSRSRDQYRATANRRYRAAHPLGESSCPHCSSTFRLTRADQVYCSQRCKDRASGKRTRPDARRRARKRGSATEPVRPAAVFSRDGWRCGLCSRSIPASLSYPHPDSASVDHIVPLAFGGAHTYANVQAAHLRCNQRKSTGVFGDAEQLRLVG